MAKKNKMDRLQELARNKRSDEIAGEVIKGRRQERKIEPSYTTWNKTNKTYYTKKLVPNQNPVLKTKKAQTIEKSDKPSLITDRDMRTPSQKAKDQKALGRKINSTYKKVEKKNLLGQSVSKERGAFTRTVDGRDELVREKKKTVTRKDGTVKKSTTKGKGIGNSVIGRYKSTQRYK